MSKNRPRLIVILLSISVCLLALINIGIGDIYISPISIVNALLGQGDKDVIYTLLYYRAPRICLAVLVGASLAIAGAVMQSILRNPLAAPDTLGVSGGAAISALALISFFPAFSFLTMSLAAFVGGSIAAAIVYILAYKNGTDPVRLALVGVSVSALCGSGVEFTLLRIESSAQTSLLWLNGSLFGRGWEHVAIVVPFFLIILLVVLLLFVRLEGIKLGDETAIGLGISVEKTRIIFLGLSTLLTGVSISAVGMIGFVGLISPHIAQQLVGHRFLLPVSILVGSLVLLIADTIGRTILHPLEIPAGIVTSLLGAPYFLFLLYQESKKNG